MPLVPNLGLDNKPFKRIPVIKGEFESDNLPKRTVLNADEVKKAEIKLRESQLIQKEKERLGEEEYQRRLAMRIKGML